MTIVVVFVLWPGNMSVQRNGLMIDQAIEILVSSEMGSLFSCSFGEFSDNDVA